jgi:hypothetical protein
LLGARLVDQKGFAISIQSFCSRGCDTSCRHITNRHLFDFAASSGGDAIAPNAFVDNGVIVPHDIVVNYGAVFVDGGGVSAIHVMPGRSSAADLTFRNESISMHPQPEIKANTYPAVAIVKSHSRLEMSFGGQWSPTTITSGIAPTHPGRSPDGAWNPNPAMVR